MNVSEKILSTRQSYDGLLVPVLIRINFTDPPVTPSASVGWRSRHGGQHLPSRTPKFRKNE